MVGELFAERYELEELTGSGGMSCVYRARDRRLARRVAIKVLHDQYAVDPEHIERFRREARAAARLNHPNIVTVIDHGEWDGQQYIVFEHVDGENLKELVGRAGPLPVRRALELAIEIAQGLAFAHANGIVHRDVKPQNVLLREGSAKVTDFGIARSVGLDTDTGQTTTGTVLGTGDYISPEQARGERATERSDVYSLGALLYELLTARVPFPAENAVAAAMRHVSEPVPDVLDERPDVPARLATAVSRAMAKDPADRFESMESLLAELRACRDELAEPDPARTAILRPVPATAPAEPFPMAARRPPRRSRRAPVAVLVVLLLSLVGVGAYFAQRTTGGSVGGAQPAAAGTVRLKAVASYDPPPGDGREGDNLLSKATDGKPGTYWETERYTTAQFGNLKRGVGIVLEAAEGARLRSLTIQTGTPGFTAVVEAGDSASGPFAAVSSPQSIEQKTTFSLSAPAARRYYLIWITMLTRFNTGDASKPFAAEVAEVSAS